MFGTSSFGDIGFGVVPVAYRGYVEADGSAPIAFTTPGISGWVNSSTGTSGIDFSAPGLGARISSGVGTASITFTANGQSGIVSGASGTAGFGFDAVGVVAFYEMPHDPADYRVMTVGLRRYIWRPDLGRWRPAGSVNDASLDFNFLTGDMNITIPTTGT